MSASRLRSVTVTVLSALVFAGCSSKGSKESKGPVPSTSTDSDAGSSGGPDASNGESSASDAGGVAGGDADGATAQGGTWWKPGAGVSFQWDLSGTVSKLDVAVDVYDIDGFENTKEIVEALHAQGKKVICYISVGTLETGRPDAGDFPDAAKGKYWPEWGEYYIDIRSAAVRDVMKKRLDMCKQKGFDGVEPDNMDMFEGGMSETGFALTEEDGIDYATFLATEAHARGLSIGQKNAASITGALEGFYDWALTEDCFADGWCDDLAPYTSDDKPVFTCEYTDTAVNFNDACAAAKTSRYSAILKHRDLDSWIQFCP